MMVSYNKLRYVSPELMLLGSDVWSGICAESVVTEVNFNQIAAEAQESGGEVDFSKDDTFNHTWEDVAE